MKFEYVPDIMGDDDFNGFAFVGIIDNLFNTIPLNSNEVQIRQDHPLLKNSFTRNPRH